MKGIMFTEDMFTGVVELRKSMTRRIVNNIKHKGEVINIQSAELVGKGITEWTVFDMPDGRSFGMYPRYRRGEIVYLKEPYRQTEKGIAYRYCFNNPLNVFLPWKNKMFMPAKYARYFIEITGVRIQRLNEIQGNDICAEGVRFSALFNEYGGVEPHPSLSGLFRWYQHATTAYQNLWESINGPGSWKLNPFVWVYEFKMVPNPQL
jgi:hypothetical protein